MGEYVNGTVGQRRGRSLSRFLGGRRASVLVLQRFSRSGWAGKLKRAAFAAQMRREDRIDIKWRSAHAKRTRTRRRIREQLNLKDPGVVFSLLEADQVVAAKRQSRFGPRNLSARGPHSAVGPAHLRGRHARACRGFRITARFARPTDVPAEPKKRNCATFVIVLLLFFAAAIALMAYAVMQWNAQAKAKNLKNPVPPAPASARRRKPNLSAALPELPWREWRRQRRQGSRAFDCSRRFHRRRENERAEGRRALLGNHRRAPPDAGVCG